MSDSMRKHLAEIQAIATYMTAALDRGDLPMLLDANIIEYRATALAVEVRKAFIDGIVAAGERTPEQDRAAQVYVETRRAG